MSAHNQPPLAVDLRLRKYSMVGKSIQVDQHNDHVRQKY